ncbi:tRNA uridine-5-carboxymethylaminomethyl(34) synthesis GTPase MnmE [Pacificimonas flava]|uniref:tRNA modification GTPase MnmE n=2 Tax=Pacificimonas TaxID=1960290 RepID=A0A219B2X2_9SPHN|nr:MULTISPECIES: tRNA uridine-5-carboxymethylaminomethyl(34) synthesis GTPase MnmE [Pacificimonas]MBZ6377622.1 tRNA uridine-5-carboxymethylaminomethyl(34) synthesis GTPase MnmE [Pacificimonas aurantium]OWV32690.1 tRNA uridine-5-carboxymethylaminomethyl(34) synthesis GTPase MnmE [Pacificimonas flava]
MTHSGTIFALASGALPAAVAIIRVSGAEVRSVLTRLTGGAPLPEPRRAALRTLRTGDGQELERGLILFFPGPASFTGEDVAELQVTGSVALVERLYAELSRIEGLRLAEAGEFARRAVANGKLDLTEAEGLAALIDAETEAQLGQALMAAGGRFRRAAEGWRADLLAIAADAEAELDFGEGEADVEDRIRQDAELRIDSLAADIETALEGHVGARLIRRGATLAVSGPPNAGKSSLVNALSRSDAAIVSDIPGTTRDAIEVPLDIAGFRVTLIDTAGLRDTDDPIERMGVARAREKAANADLVLDLGPDAVADERTLVIAAKADLHGSNVRGPGIPVSARTGEGIEQLLSAIAEWLRQRAPGGDLVTTSERQKAHLEDCVAALQLAAKAPDPVLRAEELRAALTSLGRLTGDVETEELLGAIFSRFCIGK